MVSRVRLDIKNCNHSCQYYLAPEGEMDTRCTYNGLEAVTPNTPCKYEFLTESSVAKLTSPEEKLLKSIYGGGLEPILSEAREQLGLE